MSDQRIVVLVPADRDADPDHAVYWQNFIWRVTNALKRGGVNCQIVVAATPGRPEGGT